METDDLQCDGNWLFAHHDSQNQICTNPQQLLKFQGTKNIKKGKKTLVKSEEDIFLSGWEATTTTPEYFNSKNLDKNLTDEKLFTQENITERKLKLINTENNRKKNLLNEYSDY